jgi:hypothetical protein
MKAVTRRRGQSLLPVRNVPCPVRSGFCAEAAHVELATPITGRAPLAEAPVSSVFLSPVLSRVARERLFCPEADWAGSTDGWQGKLIGVGSTTMLSRSF